MDVVTGPKEYFPNIDRIAYEGRETDNPLAFRYYDEEKIVNGRSLKEFFRFAVAYWHSFGNEGGDPFGAGTRSFPWMEYDEPMDRARAKMDAAFEFITKMGIPFYCFHDYDLVEEAESLEESEKRLQQIVEYARQK
ncbi:MAG TPA: hypothetical protein VJ905_07955, partial [Halalkalibaculum sp.]|nr:hypothetical protein [Halalkalibaculum sp.]